MPWPLRPFAIFAARILWCFKGAGRVRQFVRYFGMGGGEAVRMLADACIAGLQPSESYVWRHILGAPRRPLAISGMGKALVALGDVEHRRLLTDKLAAADALTAAGVPMPRLLALLHRGEVANTLPDHVSKAFLKPRHGCRTHNTFAVDRLDEGLYRVEGQTGGADFLAAQLRPALAEDDLLVQERIEAAPELADLVTLGRAPVLRMFTAREPDGAAFLHSALMWTAVPGETDRSFLHGYLRMPVALATGSLRPGYWFGTPGVRLDESPWHRAPITGRVLPGFAEARRIAVAAAEVTDRLPFVAWDVILSTRGPVLLEGNSEGAWVLTYLAADEDAVPLIPLLNRWAERAG